MPSVRISRKMLKYHRDYEAKKYKELTAIKLCCRFCNAPLTMHSIYKHLKTKACIKYQTAICTTPEEREKALNKFKFILQIIKDRNDSVIIGDDSIISKDDYKIILELMNTMNGENNN